MSELMMWRSRWQAKIAQNFTDPHYATAPTTTGLKPQNINTSIVGEHVSVVFSPAVMCGTMPSRDRPIGTASSTSIVSSASSRAAIH
jgi:hypothetical protein